jgi:hypothetical protein
MAEDSKAAAMAKDVEAEATAETVKGEVGAEDSKAALAKAGTTDTMADASKGGAAAESVPTLRQVFSLPEKETDPSDDNWKSFQERVSKEVKGVKWIASMPDLAPKVCELLDIKVPDILVTAWKKVQDIQKVLEESKKTPDKVVYLELAEHTIDYQTKPSIDVKIKRATVKKLELPIQLGFKLRGFVLKIQNGGIREMQTGNCEAKGTIKYGTVTVAEKKLEAIKLPFSIPIPDNIAFLTPAVKGAAEPGDKKAEEKAVPDPAVPVPNEPLERIEL